MEDFKKSSKMQCFKEGGSVQKEVNFTKRDRKSVEPNDMSQDKKLVKKAFAQHDKAKHGGSEPTEIKLKKGGRAKKECGTVKKFKCGGGVYGAGCVVTSQVPVPPTPPQRYCRPRRQPHRCRCQHRLS